ncbi:archaeosortase A [Natronomonas salina]|nr:archaeosortase A [Natronomonas salina]
MPITDVLAWVVIGAFLAGALAEWTDRREIARRTTVGAWWLFALFWLLLIQHFAFVHRSIVETLLLFVAVPGCLYVGWLLLQGRDSLLVLSRGIAYMGLIYMPFLMSAWARGLLIEVVAQQSYFFIDALGFDRITLTEGQGELGGTLTNTFDNDVAGVNDTRVVFACTGIESMAMFGGLIAAVQAPLRRKAVGVAVSVGVIWVLNIFRNVFIAVANAYQWFTVSWIEGPVIAAFGLSDPARVSFFFADRVLSQSLAVVALVGVAWLISRWVPEILDIAEELLYLLTGSEVELRSRAPSVEDPDATHSD